MIRDVLELSKWRFVILRKQKLLISITALGLFACFVSYGVAQSSYLMPLKIFWDFILGLTFGLLSLLAIYTSSVVFSDEKNRRTLHLILASGVSRRTWVYGNALGIWLVFAAILLFWSLFGGWVSFLIPDGSNIPLRAMVAQTQLAFSFELMVLVSMSLALSFYLRFIVALLLSVSLFVFLHSQVSLINVLMDAQTGAFNNPLLLPLLQWITPLFPPLEWFDLKLMVGYEVSVGVLYMLKLLGLALAWSIFWLELGLLKFQKTDL